MLRTLENFQYGLITPRSFEYAVSNQRILNMGLSNHVTLERFHTAPVNAMDIDRIEERFLISGAKNGGLCIHDLQNSSGRAGHEAKVVCDVPRHSSGGHDYCVTTVQFHPYDTGAFVSSGMDCLLSIWDTNRMLPDLQIELSRKIYCHHVSAVSTHGEIIAVGMQHPHALLVDPRKGGKCHELRGHERTVPCVRWSPLSEFVLATGGSDGRVLLWDVRSARGPISAFDAHNEREGARSARAHDGVVNGLRFTDDGLHLVSIGADNHIRLWDVVLGSNTLVNYGLTINHGATSRQRAIDLCCSTNPPVLFVPSSNYIHLFDLLTGDRLRTLVGHFSLVNCCTCRPSLHQLVSGGNDCNILLWTPDDLEAAAEGSSSSRRKQRQQRATPAPDHDSDNWSSDENDPN